jgi:phage repressor protein C with HTH and peptisase S24 domain
MLTHTQVWTALDRLAASVGLSPSGLAKKSGLDPTTFNKSKRITRDGRPRWPSTESLAKALAATGSTIQAFVQLMDETGRAAAIRSAVPLIGLAQAGKGGYFDASGFPSGTGWEEIPFPAVNDEHAYALEVSGDALAPTYREGSLLIVSPAASIRRGDRVVIKTTDHEVAASELKRRTTKTIELRAINPPHPERILPVRDVLWMARIAWASQ